MFDGLWDPLNLHRNKLDEKFRAGVLDRQVGWPHGTNPNSQFLSELAISGLEKGFPGLELAARKLPEASMALVSRSVTNEETVALADNCCNYSGEGAQRYLRKQVIVT